MQSSIQHHPKTFALFAAFLTAVTLAAPHAYAEDADAPEFKSRQERRAYYEKLRSEDPEKFEALMKEKREKWAMEHPQAAERFKDGGKPGFHPGDGRGPGRDFRENRFDRREDRWDARHEGGPRDRIEDRADRREDRWDAHHGPDRVHPGRYDRYRG